MISCAFDIDFREVKIVIKSVFQKRGFYETYLDTDPLTPSRNLNMLTEASLFGNVICSCVQVEFKKEHEYSIQMRKYILSKVLFPIKTCI